jgi:hypothetical protein
MRMSDIERRRRLVRRHHLGRTSSDVVAATRAVVALHSSDPISPHLGLWARVRDYSVTHLEEELLDRRRLSRMHAMRRTLFVVCADEAATFQAGTAQAVAQKERRRLMTWLGQDLEPDEVPRWLDDMSTATLEALDGAERSTRELTELVPALGRKVTLGSGAWTTTSPVASRLLFLLAMEGRIVRAGTVGSWRSSQYRWARSDQWRATPAARPNEQEARAALAMRYLAAFGPATITDLRWWTGWTVSATREALAHVDTLAVELDTGETGWVLANDIAPTLPQPSAVALLPSLDPTPMGWKQREWFLSDHEPALYDTNGNVGPTIWLDGRIVGGWGQRPNGEVAYQLLEDITAADVAHVAHETEALTRWLDGVVAIPRFPTPLGTRLST